MGHKSDDELARHRLGAAIRQIRAEQKLTRRELERATGLSYPYLSEIEAGKKSPSTRTLRAIADALGLEAHELLESAETGATSSWTPPRRSHFHESRASLGVAAESASPLSPRSQQSMLTPASGEPPPDVLFSPLERSPSEGVRFAARYGPRPQDPRSRLAELANQLPPEDVALLIRLATGLRRARRAGTNESRKKA